MSAGSRAGEERAAGRGVALAAASTLLLLWPTLFYPYARDQGVFAYVGHVVARGGMPYRDAWDLKPPGVYLLYAAVTRICGGDPAVTEVGVRVLDLLLAGVTGALLSVLAGRWIDRRAGPVAAAWYAALYLHGGAHGRPLETAWGLAQAETWALPCLLGALVLVNGSADERTRARSFAAGILIGAVAVLKFTMLLPALAIAAIGSPVGTARSRSSLLLTGGCLLLPTLAAAWLYFGGAWPAYRDVQSGFVAPYTRLQLQGPAAEAGRLLGYTSGWLLATWPAAALSAAGLASRPIWRERGRTAAGSLLLLGLCAVWVQNKYFGYHWQAALPGVTLGAAAGTFVLCRRARLPERRLPLIGVALAAVWTLALQWPQYRDAARLAAGTLPREAWLARFGAPSPGDLNVPASLQVATYVRSHTAPGDRIFVWGFEPSVYLFARREPPTRFFFNVPLTAPFSPPEWRTELLSDLRRQPPELVVVVRHDAVPWASGQPIDSAEALERWDDLRDWLRSGYDREVILEDFTLYRRLPPVPHPTATHARAA